MRIPAGILAVAFALLACGCGGDEAPAGTGDASKSTETSEDHYPLSDEDDPRFATISSSKGERPGPDIEPAVGRAPPKEMMIRDLEVGTGPAAELGDEIAVRYLGVNYETGEDASLGWLPSPPTFRLGFSQYGAYVWQEGLVGMRVGGRRELILPGRWASGPDAIDYVIELVRLEPAAMATGDDPRFGNVAGGEGRDEPVVVLPDRRPPQELLIGDLEVGSGRAAQKGDRVSVRYLGVDYKTGDVQFRGWKFPAPLNYRLGSSGNGQGFEEGIVGMREGGRRELVIPRRLTFGTGTIVYVVELVRLEPVPAPPPAG